MHITLADALVWQIRVQANQVIKLHIWIDGCKLQCYPFFKEVSCLIMRSLRRKIFPAVLFANYGRPNPALFVRNSTFEYRTIEQEISISRSYFLSSSSKE